MLASWGFKWAINHTKPNAVNNPHGLAVSPDEGLKRRTRVGEGVLREVAAYILDHPKGGYWPYLRIGSSQMFMKNDGSCEDMGPSRFPVEEVHKISVIDLRMANADRHAGNILFRKGEDGQTVLIPIDHG
ncbi:hypothetical protein ACE6H2_017485 [Prunus campanulata]